MIHFLYAVDFVLLHIHILNAPTYLSLLFRPVYISSPYNTIRVKNIFLMSLSTHGANVTHIDNQYYNSRCDVGCTPALAGNCDLSLQFSCHIRRMSE